MGDLSLLIIVGARGGSKGLPGKNKNNLAGKSLLRRTAETIEQSGIPHTSCILSTDNDQIAEIGKKAGLHVPFSRPSELAQDSTSAVDVVLHALQWSAATKGISCEAVMWLQPTSPFRTPGNLKRGYDMLCQDTSIDAIIGVKRIYRSLSTLFFSNDDLDLRPVDTAADRGDQRQATKPLFTPNGALYLIRSSVLKKEKSFFPQRLRGIEMDKIESIDIDDHLDWKIAEGVILADEHKDGII